MKIFLQTGHLLVTSKNTELIPHQFHGKEYTRSFPIQFLSKIKSSQQIFYKDNWEIATSYLLWHL